MGVRGLTSFVARSAEHYLSPYELHDCNLVVDGDNLACNLYGWVTGTYSAFGGDYDDFFVGVLNFFKVLAECNVQAYVLMDGGYEQRKLRTVAKRLRDKISVIKRINPCNSVPLFPVFMKEVFVDAVRASGVPVMRCIFEADDELAALGRKLNCPVLSYDSDFYIHNVQYIPIITVTLKAHTKCVNDGDQSQPTRRLKKNEARHIEKLTNGNRVMGVVTPNNVEGSRRMQGKTYKYLDCCIYRVENLIKRHSLSKEKLPLFAALLGNDYISASCFRDFFKAGLGKVGRSKKANQKQKRIRAILEWLKHETTESALNKILSKLGKHQRPYLLARVEDAMSGYSNEICHSYDFFKEHYDIVFKEIPSCESAENEMCDDEVSNGDSDEESIEKEEEDSVSSINSLNSMDKSKEFPAWFLEKLYPGKLQRYFVDLLHIHKYINSPQIEHFPYNDCNEIALPILIYTFTLLNSTSGHETEPKCNPDGTPYPIEFTYLARSPRVTNINYTRYAMGKSPAYIFDPRTPNPLLFNDIFRKNMQNLDVTELFIKVHTLPKDLQLYFLAIVYFLQKSQHCTLVHLHALLICVVVLRTIDSKIPHERCLNAFKKRFGKIIKTEELVRKKESLANGGTFVRPIREDLKSLSVPERMSSIQKSDCILVQNNLLPHFHLQTIFKKKYDTYSTIVLHGFSEFQSVLFQMYGLNALLDCPFNVPKINQLFSGIFIYNLHDLLRSRCDIHFYVENFILQDSRMMFDFYSYLWDWCDPFIPKWIREKTQKSSAAVNKKSLRKRKKKTGQSQKNQIEQNSLIPTLP